MDLKRLAHYDIVVPIGAGGMGEVYRARDAKLGRDVALKLLPEHFARDADRLSRFEREARLLASLNHPRIAAIYGLEQDGQHRFLVLELVEGEDLSKRIARGPIPLDDALAVAQQVCEALEAAHEAGVVHRDLKPSNVVVTPNGSVKVLDFGLAKALDPATNSSNLTQSPTILGSSPTLQGVILGTAAYMSPEQARGKLVDKRADIFAFGCVLFEMLSGKQTFSGETVSDTLAAVLRSEPDWSALPKGTPRAIDRLLRRCLEKDPKRRLRDIGEATLVIDDVLSGRAPDEPPAGTSAPAKRGLSVRAVAVIVAVAAIAAAMASVFAMRMWSPPEEARAVRKMQIVVAGEDSLGAATDPCISPDGLRIAYHCGGSVWIRALDDLTPRRIAESATDVAPFWSPDGAFLGFATLDKLWKVPAAGGEPTPVCEAPANFGGGAGASWGSDEKIVFSSGSSGIYEVAASGGDAREIQPIDPAMEQDFHTPVSLPGGKGLLVVQHRARFGPDTILLIANGQRKPFLTLEGQNIWSLNYSPTGHILYTRLPDNPGLWALPFSLASLEVTGEPFLIAPQSSAGSASRDGTLAYQPSLSGDRSRISWISADGKTVTPATDVLNNVNSFALSPDGKRLVVSLREGSARDLWVMDLERNTRTKLTFVGNYNLQPLWSPDGTQVIFRDQAENTIYVVPADGTSDRRRIVKPASFATFTPDMRWVVYSAPHGEDKQLDLFMRRFDDTDTTTTALLQASGQQRYATISPDGKLLAYSSNESGSNQIYLTTFPTPTGKWQVSVTESTWPVWTQSSDRLFFCSDDAIQYVEVDEGPPIRLGTPTDVVDVHKARIELWGFRKLDVAPDGTRVLVVQTVIDEDRLNGIVVTENWLEEFSKR